MIKKIKVKEIYNNVRLDIFLGNALSITRSSSKNIILNNLVTINGLAPKKAGHKVFVDDVIEVDIKKKREINAVPENIPLAIVYEDKYIAVINKPIGMVTHPAVGNYSGTLVNALLYHIKNLSRASNDKIRPGIVHRLDKDTSGIMIVAKTEAAHLKLSEDIKEKKIRRIYRAICYGVMEKDKGIIDENIDRDPKDRRRMSVCQSNKGRKAITYYRVVERLKGYSYVEFELSTGRTHQIRVHSKFIGHPVLGDSIYGHNHRKNDATNQMLHSYFLEFQHPIKKRKMSFECPLPDYFEQELLSFKNVY